MRSKAFMEVGGSPTYTLTEDFALGMELKKYEWQCRYVQVKPCAILNTIDGFQIVTSCHLSLLAPSKSLACAASDVLRMPKMSRICCCQYVKCAATVNFLPTLTSCAHAQEYLAVGEAPDQIRNCFQQRSRWTKVRTDSS